MTAPVIIPAAAMMRDAPGDGARRTTMGAEYMDERDPLTLNAYQRSAARTGGSDLLPGNTLKGLSCAALGLTGEAGEVADIVKKVVHHRHPLDKATREKLTKELGDVLWYIAHAANVLEISLDDIAHANIEKLRKRYPDGFSSERSLNREDG